MHPQLLAITEEFRSAQTRFLSLVQHVPDEDWNRRPAPADWSAGECIVHLNLTAAAALPMLRDGLVRAREEGGKAPTRYRRDVMGWLLWKSMGPQVRFRVKAAAPFLPKTAAPKAQVLEEFIRLQEQQIAAVAEADGLPIDRVKITSPFDARVRYNLYALMTVLPHHQHRHLGQAERACQRLGGGN